MNQPEIRIYTGKIQAWTRDVLSCKSRESLCGRRLLAYGLLDWGREDLFGNIHRADELYAYLEGMIKKGNHGKPYFRENLGIHFNISHSGVYGACALSFIPCGLDIQEVRKVRSRKMLERVLSREEQELVQKAQNPEVEFCRFWARKESFLKLSGDGITRSMRDLEQPGWYQEFQVDSQVLGCICAGAHFQVSIQQVPQEKFFQRFLV